MSAHHPYNPFDLHTYSNVTMNNDPVSYHVKKYIAGVRILQGQLSGRKSVI